MTPGICVLVHRYQPERARRQVEGLLVCARCLSRLEQCLAELPAQWRALAVVLAPRTAAGAKVSGSPDAQLPIDPVVAELRVDVLWKLVSWVRLIAERRGFSEPTSNEVGSVASWLLVQLRWVCAQPWVDEYAAELLGYESEAYGQWVPGVRGRVISALSPSGRRHVVVGDCIERAEGPTTVDGRVPMCPGRLVATIAAADTLLPSALDCDMCAEHTWAPHEWLGLGRRLHQVAS